MPFATVAIPFAEFQSLPTPQDRWALTALVRYCNKAGECWPTLRALALDLGVSESTACRWMQKLAVAGVFEVRRRTGNGSGRFFYKVAARFLPRWPGKQPPNSSYCSDASRLAQPTIAKEARPFKQGREALTRPIRSAAFKAEEGLPRQTDWEPRLRGWLKTRFWLAQWGSPPGSAGCIVPASVMAAVQSLPTS